MYKKRLQTHICKCCGKEFTHHFFRTHCPDCRSKKASEASRNTWIKRGEYSIKRWEDCFLDREELDNALKGIAFLESRFSAYSDSILTIKKRLESRLNALSASDISKEALDYILSSRVWDMKCSTFIVDTLYELHGIDELPEEHFLHKYIAPLFFDFIPSPVLCTQLFSHFNNHQSCCDPLKLKPLMQANLALAVFKEFRDKYKDKYYEANK